MADSTGEFVPPNKRKDGLGIELLRVVTDNKGVDRIVAVFEDDSLAYTARTSADIVWTNMKLPDDCDKTDIWDIELSAGLSVYLILMDRSVYVGKLHAEPGWRLFAGRKPLA